MKKSLFIPWAVTTTYRYMPLPRQLRRNLGTVLKRVTDEKSPYYGKLITQNGLPTATTEKQKIGNQQPDALLGISSTFNYKGWSLNFLIDSRFGGDIFSGTHQTMQAAGTSNVTVVNGERPQMVVDGVFMNEKGEYEEKTPTENLLHNNIGMLWQEETSVWAKSIFIALPISVCVI